MAFKYKLFGTKARIQAERSEPFKKTDLGKGTRRVCHVLHQTWL
jgi:hypothetical protein